jgi:sirohydrochlorin ferrochelatase
VTLLAESPRRTLTTPALVAVSHGTSSPAGQNAVAALVAAVAFARPEVRVTGGFVDVQQPDVRAVLASTAQSAPAVVVPLLLSAGFHVHIDLRRELDATVDRVTALTRALGPDDRLVDILLQRLREAGIRESDRIVLACAGSSDGRAVDDCHEMSDRLSRRLGRPVRVGFISAAFPRLPDAVGLERAHARGARVVVSTYLLAPGYFSDLARATRADVVTEPLLSVDGGVPRGLVELVLDRYEAVARHPSFGSKPVE